MSYGATTINTVATLIIGGNSLRRNIVLANNSTGTIYIGQNASLTTANGLVLSQGGYYSEETDAGRKCWLGPFYGICETGTADIRYLEVNE